MERERTVAELQKREDTMEKLESENQSLSTETSILKGNLEKINNKTSELQQELEQIHERLVQWAPTSLADTYSLPILKKKFPTYGSYLYNVRPKMGP